MTPESLDIIIGVVSGVLTSLLIWIFWIILKNLIIPWYQKITYPGINIAGTWEEKSNNINHKAVYVFHQNASKLTGKAVSLTGIGTNNEQIRFFQLKGSVSDRFVQFIVEHNDKRYIGKGSFLFEAVGDGQVMVGHGSIYDIKDRKILGHDSNLVRRTEKFQEIIDGEIRKTKGKGK